METAIIVAIVVGLTQIFKSFGWSEKLTPVFALLAGIGITFVGGGNGIGEQVLQGIIAGLTAMGAWSGTKTIIGK